jgi:hypothetical protein
MFVSGKYVRGRIRESFPEKGVGMFELIGGMFALGLFGWMALIAFSIVIIIGLEFESGAGTFWAAVFGVVVLFLTNNGVSIPSVSGSLHWLDANWFKMILFVGTYVTLGGAWSFAKWYFYVHNRADAYDASREIYKSEYASLSEYAKGQENYQGYMALRHDFPPSPLKNKSRIYMWMAYWPWSGLWTLLNDPLKHAWKFLYTHLSGMMTRVSKYVFGARFVEFN